MDLLTRNPFLSWSERSPQEVQRFRFSLLRSGVRNDWFFCTPLLLTVTPCCSGFMWVRGSRDVLGGPSNVSRGYQTCLGAAAACFWERGRFRIVFWKWDHSFWFDIKGGHNCGGNYRFQQCQFCRWYLYVPVQIMTNQSVRAFNSVRFFDSINL